MLLRIPTFLALQTVAVLQLAVTVNAALVNITVDDAGVDPITGHSFVFSPEGAWSQGNNCSFCSIKPEVGQMHNGTWRDVTYVPNNGLGHPTGPLNLSLTFNGSAIYAFCAVHGFTNMTFFIDDKQVNHFSDESIAGFTYNVPAFVNTSLSPGEHVFTLMNGAIDGSGNESLVLFDYIIYSQENSTSQGPSQSASLPSQSAANIKAESSSKLKPGVIGGIIAAVVVMSILVGILIWWRYQNNLKQRSHTAVQPFNNASGTIPGDSRFTLQTSSVREKRGAIGISSTSDASNSVAPSSSLPTRQVETDAGPLPVDFPLPPDYNQVLAANQRLQER